MLVNLILGLVLGTTSVAAQPPTAVSLNYSQVDILGGGSDIVLTGTNLDNVLSVTVGGTNATITGSTTTTVSFQAPAKAAGVYDVVVTTNGGSATLSASLEAWAPSTETGCTIFVERPNYAVNTGTGTWTTRVGAAPSQSSSPPAAVNGAPSFTNQELIAATIGSLMTMTGTTEGSFAVVANMATAPAPQGSIPQSTGIWADKSRGAIGASYTTDGMRFFATDGSYKSAVVPWATGAYHAGCGRFKSSDVIQASVDGSSFASASSAIGTYSASTTQNVTIGKNFGTGPLLGFTGVMNAFCMFNKKVSDAFASKFYKWSQQRQLVS